MLDELTKNPYFVIFQLFMGIVCLLCWPDPVMMILSGANLAFFSSKMHLLVLWWFGVSEAEYLDHLREKCND